MIRPACFVFSDIRIWLKAGLARDMLLIGFDGFRWFMQGFMRRPPISGDAGVDKKLQRGQNAAWWCVGIKY